MNQTDRIAEKLEGLRHLANDCFETAVHNKFLNSPKAESNLDGTIEEKMRFNESDFKELQRSPDSFPTNMRNKSQYFTAALSRITDHNMSHLSILDLKDVLGQSASKFGRFSSIANEKKGYKDSHYTEGMKEEANEMEEDYEYREEQTRSKEYREPKRSGLKDNQYLKESIFTPNLPVKEEGAGYCCKLI
jgi:hypothetical protein